MNTPPLLLGASLMFWGWHTGLWMLALPLAIIVEGSRFIAWRWQFSRQDLRRGVNLCLMILIIILIYVLQSSTFYFIYALLQWLPIILFPLLIFQVYSVQQSIDITTLFLLFNNQTQGKTKNFTINLNYFYVAICILSASNANFSPLSFYSGMFLLTAFYLRSVRSKRFPLWVWLGLLFSAGMIGFMAQIGLHQLHLTLENQVIGFYNAGQEDASDSSKKITNIGEIGVLKQSNKIVLRVETKQEKAPPRLLREATYNQYRTAHWMAIHPDFVSVKSSTPATSWVFKNPPQTFSKITIATTLPRGQGLLTLPEGTFKIEKLFVKQMERNKLGAVKVAGDVKDIAYQVYFNDQLSLEDTPASEDLQVPASEKPALEQVLQQLKIQNKMPVEIVANVEQFFLKNFTYSLNLIDQTQTTTPLSTFLLKTRAGHCEYFATATTLLLRAAGIPARYAVGYSVHEFSPLENQYIVRSRHAHAWTMVYLQGRWQVLDTTPANWTTIEDGTVSRFTFITDLGSFLSFKFSQFWQKINQFNTVGWVLLLFIMVFLWRWIHDKKVVSFPQKKIWNSQGKLKKTQRNSEFYLIEQAFNQLGLNRHPSESLKNWIYRIQKESPSLTLTHELIPILELYYRGRFDPMGLNETEKQVLNTLMQAWLKKAHQIAK